MDSVALGLCHNVNDDSYLNVLEIPTDNSVFWLQMDNICFQRLTCDAHFGCAYDGCPQYLVQQTICMHKPTSACRSAYLDQGTSHPICFSGTKLPQILTCWFQLDFGTDSKLLVFQFF